MAIEKLAAELDETVRQTRDLVASMTRVLNILMDKDLTDSEARTNAKNQIIVGLQAQDRIEQRCTNITSAMTQMQKCKVSFDEESCANIWQNLNLDELAKPELTGISTRISHGDVDLF